MKLIKSRSRNLFDVFLLSLFFLCILYFAFKQIHSYINKHLTVNNNKLSEIKWVKDSVINLDTIYQDRTVDFKATIVNSGANRLFIRNIFSSCGCTQVKLSNDEINIDDTAFIIGKINTKGKKGRAISLIHFNANTVQKCHTLRVNYYVKGNGKFKIIL